MSCCLKISLCSFSYRMKTRVSLEPEALWVYEALINSIINVLASQRIALDRIVGGNRVAQWRTIVEARKLLFVG